VNAPSTALELHSGQDFWDERQLAILGHLGMYGAPRADLEVFLHQCQRTGLDPFAKQIYMIKRKGKWTIQTAIDGFRLIARRAVDQTRGTLGYKDTEWCGPDRKWVDVWLGDQPPSAARVTVLRDGEPYPAVALYSEYVQYDGDGKVNSMWKQRAAGQLAKCAEALALRKAYPQDLSGIYTEDEMAQAGDGVEPPMVHGVGQAPAPGASHAEIRQVEARPPNVDADGVIHELDAQKSDPSPEPDNRHRKPDPEPERAPEAIPPISPPMIRNIFRLLTKLGMDTSEEDPARAERLALISGFVGEEISSTNDLNLPQGHIVIDRLKNMADEAEKLDARSAT
jgi:phage recombination protein Bet